MNKLYWTETCTTSIKYHINCNINISEHHEQVILDWNLYYKYQISHKL